jgi:hypothetical protein
MQTNNMQQKSNFLNNRTLGNEPTERCLQTRIGYLKLEQQRLEEEIGQLKVAVEIYTEVVRRQALAVGGQASKNTPVWVG